MTAPNTHIYKEIRKGHPSSPLKMCRERDDGTSGKHSLSLAI